MIPICTCNHVCRHLTFVSFDTFAHVCRSSLIRKLKRTIDPDQILQGVSALEALLPGPPPFAPNMEAMKASDWVGIVALGRVCRGLI